MPISIETHFEKFADAKECWFASTRPDGRPHMAPIWHVWMDNAAWIVTAHKTVRARNVQQNPNVSLGHPDTTQVVLIEGTVTTEASVPDNVRAAFKSKYDWNLDTDADNRCYLRVQPVKVMVWDTGSDASSRWHFVDDAWRAHA